MVVVRPVVVGRVVVRAAMVVVRPVVVGRVVRAAMVMVRLVVVRSAAEMDPECARWLRFWLIEL